MSALQTNAASAAPPLRLGLTGGIGSGKSTVAGILVSMGAYLIDADAIARKLTTAGGSAMPAIIDTFGLEYQGPEGALDRERMRQLVFTQPIAKEKLERIVHPLVRMETERQVAEALSKSCRCVVFDVPLLVESGRWRAQLDRVLVVDCLAETQVQRVSLRSGLPRETISRIMASQATRERRLAAADIVIFNDGLDMLQLQQEVSQMARYFGL